MIRASSQRKHQSRSEVSKENGRGPGKSPGPGRVGDDEKVPGGAGAIHPGCWLFPGCDTWLTRRQQRLHSLPLVTQRPAFILGL